MQRCKRIGILFRVAVVGMAFFSGASAAMAAGLFSPTGGGTSNEPTEIVSDRLVNNNTEKVAEFSWFTQHRNVVEWLTTAYEAKLRRQQPPSLLPVIQHQTVALAA